MRISPKLQKVFDKLISNGFKAEFILNKVLPPWWTPEIAENELGFYHTVAIISKNLKIKMNTLLGDNSIEYNYSINMQYNDNSNSLNPNFFAFVNLASKISEIVHRCKE